MSSEPGASDAKGTGGVLSVVVGENWVDKKRKDMLEILCDVAEDGEASSHARVAAAVGFLKETAPKKTGPAQEPGDDLGASLEAAFGAPAARPHADA